MEQKSDHDLLIRLDENVRNLRTEVGGLRENVVGRVNTVELLKVDKTTFEDYKAENDKALDEVKKMAKETSEKQDRQSMYIYIGIGIILTLQFVAMILSSYHHSS